MNLVNKLKIYCLAEKQVPGHMSFHFNDKPVIQVQLQKNLGLFLDPKLSFDEHIKRILMHPSKISLSLLDIMPH